METTLNISTIQEGLVLRRDNLPYMVKWDSNFFDLNSIADNVKIHNSANSNVSPSRIITFQFDNQEIIQGLRTAIARATLPDKQGDLATTGITAFHIDLQLYGAAAEEHFDALSSYLEKEVGTGELTSGELNISGLRYELQKGIYLELICSDFWSKGTTHNLILVITRE